MTMNELKALRYWLRGQLADSQTYKQEVALEKRIAQVNKEIRKLEVKS